MLYEKSFSLQLLPDQSDTESQALIDRFLARVPLKNGGNTIKIAPPSFDETGHFEISATTQHAFKSPDLIVEAGPDFRFPKPETTLSPDQKTAHFRYQYETLLKGKKLTNQQFTFTLIDTETAAEWSQEDTTQNAPPLNPTSPVEAPKNPSNNLLFILISAFLGGLILNVMPCVLPVLSLKLLHLLKHQQANYATIRSGFLLSTAGILTSFLALAGIVIALKQAGMALGWGFHFQEPMFIVSVILVLNLFAAVEFGLFEMQLPAFLGGKIHHALAEEGDHSAAGHFLSGAFATLLATPCSAPFLGTAISFALSGSSLDMLLVFTFMGIGLSTPYLLFAAKPSLIHFLPKPGAWMVKIKYLLGVFLLATSVWLMVVLYGQLSPISSIMLIIFTLLPGLLFSAQPNLPGFFRITILLATLCGLYFVPKPPSSQPATSTMESGWINFSESALQTALKEGKTVFVDVTADWCLTCKFNKINVLSRENVQKALRAENTLAMQADYTHTRPEIKAFLEKHNRYGIPFNIVYGKNAPDGIILSELLSEKEVLQAIEKARQIEKPSGR